MRALVACFLLLLLVATPVAAQGLDAAPAIEISGGYQYLDPEDGAEAFPEKGWYADAAFNLNRYMGLVGQAGVNSERRDESLVFDDMQVNVTATARFEQFLAGVRFSDRRGRRIVWFGHVLAGVVRVALDATVTTTDGGLPPQAEHFEGSVSEPGLEIGGGVNIRLTEHFGLRVGADTLRIFADDDTGSVFRLAAGGVVGIGRR